MPGEKHRQQGPAQVVWWSDGFHSEWYTEGRTPTSDACERARYLRARGAAARVYSIRFEGEPPHRHPVVTGFVDAQYLGPLHEGPPSPRKA